MSFDIPLVLIMQDSDSFVRTKAKKWALDATVEPVAGTAFQQMSQNAGH